VRSGLVAEFGTEEALLDAIQAMRSAGYRAIDAHTPFASEHLLEALGLPRSSIPKIVFVGAFLGAGLAYLLVSWTQGIDYPLDVGGRPTHPAPAFVPLTFETAILFASFSAFFGFLALSGLPRLWRPLFEVEGFRSATVDKFWLRVDDSDARFELDRTKRELEELAPLAVHAFGAGR
jgi:hypothetical protein